MRDSGKCRRVASPQDASQRRRLKQAHVKVPSVDKCENWDSVIPTTYNENNGYMISRSTYVVRGRVRQDKGAARVYIAKRRKDVLCDLTPYGLARLYCRFRSSCCIPHLIYPDDGACRYGFATRHIWSTLMMQPAGMVLPHVTSDLPWWCSLPAWFCHTSHLIYPDDAACRHGFATRHNPPNKLIFSRHCKNFRSCKLQNTHYTPLVLDPPGCFHSNYIWWAAQLPPSSCHFLPL